MRLLCRRIASAPGHDQTRKFTDGPATWRGAEATIDGSLFRFIPAHEPKRKRPAWYAEYMRICARCRKPVPESRRSHAQYCSDECKKKAFIERRRKKPELVSVPAAAPPANLEQKASLLPATVSQIAQVLVPSAGPEWRTTEYLTTDPAGRRVLVRIQQRVTIEFLPGASESIGEVRSTPPDAPRVESAKSEAAPSVSESTKPPESAPSASAPSHPEPPRVEPVAPSAGPVPEVLGRGKSTQPKPAKPPAKPPAKRGGIWPFGK